MKSCPTCKVLYPTDFTVCPKDGAALRPVTEFEEGAVLRGKYQILSLLGRGGMGSVYKARHLHFNELYALKVISSHLLEEPSFRQRFRSEAVVMRRLHHPNAVRVHDLDETEDGRPFIVMEYVEGKSLDQALEAGAPLEPRRALGIASQVCAALEAAHQLGLIHRDIKPANILLARTPEGGELAKVLDFGVAKVKEQSTQVYGAPSVTGTGFVVGTPAYMSPEQARGVRGEELDGRTDLYSLGVVLFEMLTGQLPFKADTPMMAMMAHVQTPPRDPRVLRADLPAPVAEVVLRALEKDPARRFSSAEAMRDALNAITEHRTVRLTPAPPLVPPHLVPPSAPPAAATPEVSPPTARQAPVPAGRRAGARRQAPRGPSWVYAALGSLALIALVVGSLVFQRRTPPPPPVEESPANESAVPTESPTMETPPPAPVSPPALQTFSPTPPAGQPSPSGRAEAKKGEVRELLQSARHAYERGDLETAAHYLRQAQALDPDNPAVQEALRRAKRALAGSPPSAGTARQQEIEKLMQQGRQAMARRDYLQALRAFEAVLTRNPKHAEAQQGRRRALRALRADQEVRPTRQRP